MIYQINIVYILAREAIECINFDQIFKDILLKFKQRQFILKDNINNAWKYHFDLFRQN